jgi:hypothetical protein
LKKHIMSAEQTKQPTTVTEWFEAEKDPQIRTLLLVRREYNVEADTRRDALEWGFSWDRSPEGEDVWEFFAETGHLVLAPWRIVLASETYSRVLCERDGELNFFEGEVEGQKDLIVCNIFKHMSQNDALDYLRDEHKVHVYVDFVINSSGDMVWNYHLQFTDQTKKTEWATIDASQVDIIIPSRYSYPEAIAAGIDMACKIINKRNMSSLTTEGVPDLEWESIRRMEKH